MNLNPDEIYERLRIAGEEWADNDAAANLLEETKRTLLAELKTGFTGSDAERERNALATAEYKLHLKNMTAARKTANRSKVRYETGKVWAELMRTKSANMREEMRQK